MEKNIAEIRFEKARKKLSGLLRNLEEVIKEKVHEAAFDSGIVNSASNGLQEESAKIIEQNIIIKNLNAEINHLQKNLSDLGIEAENLSKEKKDLLNEFHKIHDKAHHVIAEVEDDLNKIKEVINGN